MKLRPNLNGSLAGTWICHRFDLIRLSCFDVAPLKRASNAREATVLMISLSVDKLL